MIDIRLSESFVFRKKQKIFYLIILIELSICCI